MRRISIFLLAAITTLMTAAPASAAAPSREFLAAGPFDVDGPCPFVVHVEYPVNKEYLISFTDANGDLTRAIIQGDLVASYTNVENGRSVTLNVSGPACSRSAPTAPCGSPQRGTRRSCSSRANWAQAHPVRSSSIRVDSSYWSLPTGSTRRSSVNKGSRRTSARSSAEGRMLGTKWPATRTTSFPARPLFGRYRHLR
jgi:hypothetical protein